MIDTLNEADFQKIDLDSSGNFSFSNALSLLKRSIVGIHNKIFPMFVMNDVSNPVVVAQVQKGITKTDGQSQTPTGAGTYQTVWTVPPGKRWILKSGFINTLTWNGTITESALEITPAITSSFPASLSEVSGNTPFYIFVLPSLPILLKEGDQVRIYTSLSAYTAGNLIQRLVYEEI